VKIKKWISSVRSGLIAFLRRLVFCGPGPIATFCLYLEAGDTLIDGGGTSIT